MTIEQLRTYHQGRPFRPFRVHIADGRQLDVLHPEYLAHSPSGRAMSIYKTDETSEVVDFLLVTSLEVLSDSLTSRQRSRRS